MSLSDKVWQRGVRHALIWPDLAGNFCLARSGLDGFADVTVKHTPPDILQNNRGCTLTVPEEEDKIISQFVQEMLTNFSFLNNRMVQPDEVSAIVFYIDINPT